jgi:hypothetical protein
MKNTHHNFSLSCYHIAGILALCLLNSCGLFDSDVNTQAHISQITVTLTGEYASSEAANVSIDGVFLGVLTDGDVLNKEVQPGRHVVSATDRFGKFAWNQAPREIMVDSNTTFTFTLPCDAVELSVDVSAACDVLKGASPPFTIVVKKGDTPILINGTKTIYPGKAGFVKFDHGIYDIYIHDENQIVWSQDFSIELRYGTHISRLLDCQ